MCHGDYEKWEKRNNRKNRTEYISRSKYWHLVDYIIPWQRDLRDFLNTRAMRRTSCNTDKCYDQVPNQTTRKTGNEGKQNVNLEARNQRNKLSRVRDNLQAQLNQRFAEIPAGGEEEK